MFSCMFADKILKRLLSDPDSIYYLKGVNRYELNVIVYVVNEMFKEETCGKTLLTEDFIEQGTMSILPSLCDRYECLGFNNIPEPLGYINLYLDPKEDVILQNIITKIHKIDYFNLIKLHDKYKEKSKKEK